MKTWLGGLVSLSWIMSSAYAYTGFGICNFGKETVPAVVCYGPTVLKETTVNGDVKVAGSLLAVGVTMDSMTVTGNVDIEDVTINGNANVTGSLHANKVGFKHGLAVTSDQVTLSHTTIGGELTVSSPSSKPYLKMQCGSTVAGAVTFDGMEGVVQITDDSIVQGKIVNGSIEFVTVKC